MIIGKYAIEITVFATYDKNEMCKNQKYVYI